MIKSYKNRTLDYTKEVEVYRCLNRKGYIFSIRQNNLVVGHSDDIILKDCAFIVKSSGKFQAIKTMTRNVHAFVKGMIGDSSDIDPSCHYILKYNPFSEKGFYNMFLGEVKKSKTFFLENRIAFFQI